MVTFRQLRDRARERIANAKDGHQVGVVERRVWRCLILLESHCTCMPTSDDTTLLFEVIGCLCPAHFDAYIAQRASQPCATNIGVKPVFDHVIEQLQLLNVP